MDNTVILRLLKESNGCGLSDLGRFNIEAYTELLVKECARVQHERFCDHGDVSWDVLMNHFGIKP